MYPGARHSGSEESDPPSADLSVLQQLGSSALEDVLAMVVPDCSPEVGEHLKREGVCKGFQLMSLDKDDLKEVGFNMAQRARILRMAEQYVSTHALVPLGRNRFASIVAEDSSQERLDAAENDPNFWFNIMQRAVGQMPSSALPGGENDDDVRENILEMLFDLTPERVREVYENIDWDADGSISDAELQKGLAQYKLPEIQPEDMQSILAKVSAGEKSTLTLPEFEAVLSRLKIAQVLHVPEMLQDLRNLEQHFHTIEGQLSVTDYSITTPYPRRNLVQQRDLHEFLFGHRAEVGGLGLVRWVHLHHLGAKQLLAMMVKYSLHPLAVEDVFEQTGTKMERFGSHYFLTIEQLNLSGDAVSDGRSVKSDTPVRIEARHVSVFCAGPPYSDTLITVLQDDRSFHHDFDAEDEAGLPGTARSASVDNVLWVNKLRQRLNAKTSKLRDRRASYLLKDIVDLSADSLVAVIHAFVLRLSHIEREAKSSAIMETMFDIIESRTSELEQVQMQLQVVRRRVHSLQRALRQLHDHFDDDLAGYFRDIRDHLNEASEDVGHLLGRITKILTRYEHLHQRALDVRKEESSDRLNKTLFVLTVATTIFAPAQFLAGIYGMNFVDEDGEPGIPELRWEHGYLYFWLVVAGYLIVSITFVCWLFRKWHLRGLTDNSSVSACGQKQPLYRRLCS
mmetsp:Transcript_23746/g.54845  ORF Transcript_23746/g.54845 Transcript_23746/m.54845 type:complete len:680 (-) Transcript_23746:93-2132(-)